MDKLEKVIKGLECCINRSELRCINECPYYTDELHFAHECWLPLNRDALALLKAQEPRVMTLEEVVHSECVWIEHAIRRDDVVVALPWDIELTDDTYNFICMPNVITEFSSSYGKEWRCWTSRPTDEQRKAVKWDG